MIRRGVFAAGGFYDKRGRKVAEEVRQDLLSRSNGHCEKCGCKFAEEGDARFTVQHTATENGFALEAWCYRCNMNHVKATAVPAESVESLVFHLGLERRIRAPTPTLLCDDPDNWPATYRRLQYPARHGFAEQPKSDNGRWGQDHERNKRKATKQDNDIVYVVLLQ
jgi:hypothetical protein